jgi:hypothetical protein
MGSTLLGSVTVNLGELVEKCVDDKGATGFGCQLPLLLI